MHGDSEKPAATGDGATGHRFRCAGCGNIRLVPDDPVALAEIWAARCESCDASTTFLPDVPEPASVPLPAPPSGPALQGVTTGRSAPQPATDAAEISPSQERAHATAVPMGSDGSWFTAPFLVMSERWYAARGSKRLLRAYRRARREHPTLGKAEFYQELVAQLTGRDRRGAALVIVRAEQSFDDWAADRSLRFRDIALYLLVEAYLKAHPGRGGARAHMERVVARLIPREL